MDQNKKTGISRRAFLKNAAVAGAAAVGTTALAGCSSGAGGGVGANANTDWLPAAWDYETDVLVIGYGGAGMWSSLIAADEGGQKVLVLEKAPLEGGGNSRINNGEWTIIDEDKASTFKDYIRTFTQGKTPDAMIEAWVDECVRNTEYADKYNMTYSISEEAIAGAIPEYAFLEDRFDHSQKLASVDGFGMVSFHELDAEREALGIEVLFNCTDERLIQNPESKEIVGTYVIIDGEEKTVKANKGVILTCGGFEFNEELKNRYLKCSPFKFEGWRFNTGDGIKMVEDVGAKLWHMDMTISMYAMWTRDPKNDFSIMVFPSGFSNFNVNRLGKRYVNENTMGTPHNGWHTMLHFDDSIADYDRIPTWMIFDQTCFEAGKLSTSQGDWFECGNFTTDLPDELRDWEGWSQDNQEEVDKGWIMKADTIEDLGKKMKEFDHWMDTETLKETFLEYQRFCAQGRDERFDRSVDTLLALDDGPYYAVPLYPGSCSTLGGPMKNEHAQVLDTTETPIPRLYSAGCFGNFQSHTYGITGGNNAENQVWGRIAGRHCSALDSWGSDTSK